VGTGAGASGAREAQLTRLYDTVFDRAPDSEGLAFWTNALNSGITLDTVADVLVASQEFQSRNGTLSNAEFVSLLYRNGLEREADAAGRDFWTGGLQRGAVDRGGVALALSESAEGLASPTPDTGQQGTVTATGTTGTGAGTSATGTPGMGAPGVGTGAGASGAREAQLTRLYDTVFDRAPDSEGLAFWTNALNSGITLDTVADRARGVAGVPKPATAPSPMRSSSASCTATGWNARRTPRGGISGPAACSAARSIAAASPWRCRNRPKVWPRRRLTLASRAPLPPPAPLELARGTGTAATDQQGTDTDTDTGTGTGTTSTARCSKTSGQQDADQQGTDEQATADGTGRTGTQTSTDQQAAADGPAWCSDLRTPNLDGTADHDGPASTADGTGTTGTQPTGQQAAADGTARKQPRRRDRRWCTDLRNANLDGTADHDGPASRRGRDRHDGDADFDRPASRRGRDRRWCTDLWNANLDGRADHDGPASRRGRDRHDGDADFDRSAGRGPAERSGGSTNQQATADGSGSSPTNTSSDIFTFNRFSGNDQLHGYQPELDRILLDGFSPREWS
jgi:hypothetical protein